ncbi:unnamed protein product [Scytosiphon promiscuus]
MALVIKILATLLLSTIWAVIFGAMVGSATCSNGFPGIQASNDNGEVCCRAGCNQCGGAGCGSSGAAEGLDNTDCCINGILNNQVLCSTRLAAPCIMDNKGVGTCESLAVFGIEGTNDSGSVCCPYECGQCGGAGCGDTDEDYGYTNEDCCINGVLRTKPFCYEHGVPPCVI